MYGERIVADLMPIGNQCGLAQQNTHQQLVNLFGAGTPTTTPPDVSVIFPASASTATPSDVVAYAGAQRGVFNVDLYLNGWKWGSVPAAAFGSEGQPASQYPFAWPSGVPNGVIDIVAKAYDDLGIETDSAPVTITIGAPCMDAMADCAAGQTCAGGRCSWPAATGEFGDACTYPQFCLNGECEGLPGSQICSTDCDPRLANSCAVGYPCAASSDSTGFCVTASSGGCSVSSGSRTGGWLPAGLGSVVLAIRLRRRKPRRSRSTIER